MPVYRSYSHAHQPYASMTCEPLNDGTEKFRCVFEYAPTPMWVKVVAWTFVAIAVTVPLVLWLIERRKWNRWIRGDSRKGKLP